MRDIEAYECYVEAAIHFAGSALYHLEREYVGRLGGETKVRFKAWLEQRQADPLIASLINTRDVLVHAHPIRLSLGDDSLADTFYPEGAYEEVSPAIQAVHTRLPRQLDEIGAIIKDCERRYK